MPHTICHTTRYLFETPVSYALQKVRLKPLPGPLQDVLSWDIDIAGGKIEAQYLDHYGNHVDLVSADPGTRTLTITATGQVSVKETTGVLGKVYGRAPLWHFRQHTPLTEPDARIRDVSGHVAAAGSLLAGLHALSAAILETVQYQSGTTDMQTTAAGAMELGTGVCQDHAHIFVSAARHAGVPARYVSGYLHMPGQTDQDASHAWAEAHLDDLGWVGFDVSNGISPDTNYIRIAMGRDAQDAAPVSGLRVGAGNETMVVSVQVQQ